ncbi:hypothetical protein QVD17_09141 [Tagetes erecta]|uniref:Uncharacterized protein n=1 Tax=Tagetes erecta TaxID=13708 RepID=A0AAD8L419_TARER|nr:hypothetical protein QVD17_09141 [Tagetes erecta]
MQGLKVSKEGNSPMSLWIIKSKSERQAGVSSKLSNYLCLNLKGNVPMVYLKKIVDGYGARIAAKLGKKLWNLASPFSLRFPPILVMKSIMGWNVWWKSSFVSTGALKSI